MYGNVSLNNMVLVSLLIPVRRIRPGVVGVVELFVQKASTGRKHYVLSLVHITSILRVDRTRGQPPPQQAARRQETLKLGGAH